MVAEGKHAEAGVQLQNMKSKDHHGHELTEL